MRQTLKIKTVDEYIKAAPEESQNMLKKVRKAIREVIPKAEEIISYRMPAYKIGKGYPIIFFAAFKDHMSLFVPKLASFPDLRKGLEKYYIKGATIQFTLEKPISLELIKKIVRRAARK